MSDRKWLPPHDPEEGWDTPTEEDVAEMLGEDGLVSGVPLGGPIPGDEESDGDDHLPPRPIPEVGSPEWQADTAELAAVEGVGEARAKEIREGVRRLQEVDMVDRY